MTMLENAKLVLSMNNTSRTIPLGSLRMRELRSGGMLNGWELLYRDPRLDLVLANLNRNRGRWILEGQLHGELKRYNGGYDSGVFRVSEWKEDD